MTRNLKRETAHHNAAAHPAQIVDHNRAAQKDLPCGAEQSTSPLDNMVQADGANEITIRSETSRPVQPRAPPSRKLRFPDVIECTGLSRTTIWRRIKAGTFPAPISLGENSVGWPEHTITEWIESRPVVTYANQEATAA